MSRRGVSSPILYRQVGRADLRDLPLIPFQTEAIERFLGPVDAIRAEVLDGAVHVLTVAEAGGQPLGFFVTHPDAHDAACWWLGYLAVLPAACGHGLGRAMLASAIRRLARIPGCARIRLLVDPGNAAARRLYAAFGFTAEGVSAATGELVLARQIDRGIRSKRRSLSRPSLRRRTAAERSPSRFRAAWGMVLPGRAPPLRAAWSSSPGG